ncbi:Extracellular solute-binding protein family 5 [Bacillus thuringiensis serovar huazhongensis BGSC 4BD1]|nr:Extracellular solute-binding protein family 5 [Bacillus thuringiensis serovar huazhongensis BGSC 4BD1]
MKRKKMKKLTAVVVPVLAMSVALTACSGAGGEKKTTTTSNSGEEKNLILNMQRNKY